MYTYNINDNYHSTFCNVNCGNSKQTVISYIFVLIFCLLFIIYIFNRKPYGPIISIGILCFILIFFFILYLNINNKINNVVQSSTITEIQSYIMGLIFCKKISQFLQTINLIQLNFVEYQIINDIDKIIKLKPSFNELCLLFKSMKIPPIFSPLVNRLFWFLESLKSIEPTFSHNFSQPNLLNLKSIYSSDVINKINTFGCQKDFSIYRISFLKTKIINKDLRIQYIDYYNFIIYYKDQQIFGLINGTIKIFNSFYYNNKFLYNEQSIFYTPIIPDLQLIIDNNKFSIDFNNLKFYYNNTLFDLQNLI